MRLRVITDNNTYIDEYFIGEPAASYYVEEGDAKILFDTGYSDVFMKNANTMQIDLSKLTHIVLSHGHDDHTGGLKPLKEHIDMKAMTLVAHPDCFVERKTGQREIGSPVTVEELQDRCKVHLVTEPFWINDNVVFLGEIPVTFPFEQRKQIGEKLKSQGLSSRWEPDYVIGDSAMAVKTDGGLFIVTGCSHSGICNIIAHAKTVCKEERIVGVIGGFHLFDVDERLGSTIAFLKEQSIEMFYPCHCVSFRAKAKMNRSLPVEEVGVGLTIEC